MNVLRRELKGGLRSVLVWVLVVAGLNLLMIGLYPSFAMDSAALGDLFKLFPPDMVKALGLDRLSLADPLGYYAAEIYLVVILTGSIFAAILGSSMLAKEEDEKTIEFLLARPVTRRSMLLQKALAMGIFLAFFNLAVLAVNFAAFAAFIDRDYAAASLAHLSIAPFFAQCMFASLAFLSALFWTRRRAVYSVSLGLTMGTYFLGLVSLLSERLAWLRWISPFRYVEAVDVATGGGINWAFAAGLFLASLATVGLTVALYQRRDVTV